MAHRQRRSAEYKREAVAMLDAPGISVSQIAADLGIGVTFLGLWRRKLRQEHARRFWATADRVRRTPPSCVGR
jgi:transposase-like protein